MPVLFEKRGHVGIVTLSRPAARNAWGADFNEGIARHFGELLLNRPQHIDALFRLFGVVTLIVTPDDLV